MNYSLLLQTLSIQTHYHQEEAMVDFVISFIRKLDTISWFMDRGNIYITKGKASSYFCMAAHLDTVHEIEEHYQVVEDGEILFAQNPYTQEKLGIGGDDKVGIYCALEMLSRHDSMKAVFFSKEEIGCLGSAQASMDFFDNCHVVIQCDRRGSSDFVRETYCGITFFGNTFSKLVAPLIQSYNYSFCDAGGMTDVAQLRLNGLEIPVANISCGYYKPHTTSETVNRKDVERCLNLLIDLYRCLNWVV